MPKRDDNLLVGDMIECCKRIFEYVEGMSFDGFMDDNRTIDAVIRNFEVLGEASKYISSATKSLHPFIEWRKIGDFRNILIHDYFGIDHETVWKIIRDELPGQFEFLTQLNHSLSS